MARITIICALAAFLASPIAYSAEIIFFQDFGCDDGTDGSSDSCGAPTTPQVWNQVANPDGNGGETYESTDNVWGVTETIRVDASTRVEPNPSPFSVTGRNWDIHDGDDNEWVSGYKDPGSNTNPNMSGNMLGHEDENYDVFEDNYYQLDGIELADNLIEATLMFDFDSWIDDDVDGFGVAISTDGVDFDLLDPTGDSDMQYRLLGMVNIPDGNEGDASLNELLGEGTTTGDDIIGFDGHDGVDEFGNAVFTEMAGTAMFDLIGFAGDTISLRFVFASNSSGSLQEGINIDNIKVTAMCADGELPDCDTPPGGGVPEPSTLALAMLGLTFAYRRRVKAK